MYQDLIFIVVAYLGLWFSPLFHSLHLLAVVRKSPLLQSVIQAVTVNGRSLLVTALLCFIIVYLYSIIGFVLFPDDFRTTEGDLQCETITECLVFVLTSGLRAGGGIGDLLHDRRSTGRTLYDFSFFVIVIVCLLNIVSGIIIDTFAQLRDERQVGVGVCVCVCVWTDLWFSVILLQATCPVP